MNVYKLVPAKINKIDRTRTNVMLPCSAQQYTQHFNLFAN